MSPHATLAHDISPPSERHCEKTVTSNGHVYAPTDATKHIFVITGPAGCGKTSIAESLKRTFGMPFLEGDSFHTPEAVAKMAAGSPLTDSDRWDWLIRLREAAIETLLPSTPSSQPEPPQLIATSKPNSGHTVAPTPTLPITPSSTGVIVTCSALKQKYRDVLRVATVEEPRVVVHFLFLAVDESELLRRVRERKGHYMKDDMVRSQVASLEMPRVGEERNICVLDAKGNEEMVSGLAHQAVREILERA